MPSQEQAAAAGGSADEPEESIEDDLPPLESGPDMDVEPRRVSRPASNNVEDQKEEDEEVQKRPPSREELLNAKPEEMARLIKEQIEIAQKRAAPSGAAAAAASAPAKNTPVFSYDDDDEDLPGVTQVQYNKCTNLEELD